MKVRSGLAETRREAKSRRGPAAPDTAREAQPPRALGLGAQPNGWVEDHPTAGTLRQAAILQLQGRFGNAYVQGIVARKLASAGRPPAPQPGGTGRSEIGGGSAPLGKPVPASAPAFDAPPSLTQAGYDVPAAAGFNVRARASTAAAPASAGKDPGFRSVLTRIKGVANQQKIHDPAPKKAGEAQAAAVSPPSETEARAENDQAGIMQRAETPPFDAARFKAKLLDRLRGIAPSTLEQADEFKRNDKAGSLKQDLQGTLGDSREQSKAPLDHATHATPDKSRVPQKPVTPLPPPKPGAAPPSVGAKAAAPKKKSPAEVEQPLKDGRQSLEAQLAEAHITDGQLEKSKEPAFRSALNTKNAAARQSETAPRQYRRGEAAQLAHAESTAEATAAQLLQGMHGGRKQSLQQVAGQQGRAKTEDERQRGKVAADIQAIYGATKAQVDRLLNDLDGQVDRVFDVGAADAKRAFEDHVDSRMKAYKDRRYGGLDGPLLWLKDKLLGLPGEVDGFYREARDLYLARMDEVIGRVAAVVVRSLGDAKKTVAGGKRKIQDYVDHLPGNLRDIGLKAAQDIQGRFEELEERVDAKEDELVDRLAQKYQENLKAIDDRVEQLRADNRGLVDKAKAAIAGVIQTILQLKRMLLSVLAQAAGAVEMILRDPVGFLRHLLNGVKRGLQNFLARIGTHLKQGLTSWLFGEMGAAGLQLPGKFDAAGILSLAMQVLGVTWANVRMRAARMFGEPAVAALEQSFDIFMSLRTQGMAGLYPHVKDVVGDPKQTVMDGARSMVITQVIKAGIGWLIGVLGGPAGAFIRAAKAVYDIVTWFVENAGSLAALVQAIVSSVSAIARGAIGAAAGFVENALAGAIPLVIGFLAKLIGLGGFAEKIRALIRKLQQPVNRAIDWVLNKARSALGKIKGRLRRQGKTLKDFGHRTRESMPRRGKGKKREDAPRRRRSSWRRRRRSGAGKGRRRNERLRDRTRRKVKALKEKGEAKVARLIEWWKMRRSFRFGKERHSLYFKGKEKSAVLMVNSTPMTLESYLGSPELQAPNSNNNSTMKDIKEKIDEINALKFEYVDSRREDREMTVTLGKQIANVFNAIAELLSNLGDKYQIPPSKVEFTPKDISFDSIDQNRNPPVRSTVSDDKNGETMTAAPLTIRPGEHSGSIPTQESKLWKEVNRRSGAYVRGHLLNHHVHGRGSRENLTPITRELNTEMESAVEHFVKERVISNNEVVSFKVEVKYDGHGKREHIPAESSLATVINFELNEMNPPSKAAERENADKWIKGKEILDIKKTLKHDLPPDTAVDAAAPATVYVKESTADDIKKALQDIDNIGGMLGLQNGKLDEELDKIASGISGNTYGNYEKLYAAIFDILPGPNINREDLKKAIRASRIKLYKADR